MNLQEINEKHPEHSRTSCSDEVLYNRGWNASGNLYCIRCQCLYELKIQAEAGLRTLDDFENFQHETFPHEWNADTYNYCLDEFRKKLAAKAGKP